MTSLVPIKKSVPCGNTSRTALDWWCGVRLGTAHRGLLHEKFTHPDIKGEDYAEHLQKLIAEIQKHRDKVQNDWKDAVKRRSNRLNCCFASRHLNEKIEFKTDFLIGLGNSHPNDVGLTWHPTLGFPYIPGSAIKGLCRAAAEIIFESGQGRIDEALGPAHTDIDESDKACTGRFIFFDGLPLQGAKLVLSGLTPHYFDYHSRSEKEAVFPTDTESPNPISYLGVAAGSQFQIAIADRRAIKSGGPETVTIADVVSWFMIGLEMFGLGARTSRHFGYGKFV